MQTLRPKGEDDVTAQWLRLFRSLDEASRRRLAGQRAIEIGYGGIKQVAMLSGLSQNTVRRGMAELRSGEELLAQGRIRRPGGGRKNIEEQDPQVLAELEALLDDETRGDPMRPLRWTAKSARAIAKELGKIGFNVGVTTIRRLLKDLGYSLQGNSKTKEGGDHPCRDEQFNKINDTVESFQTSGQPVISVDAKKKELVGEFKNQGQTYRRKGNPREVNVYDFASLATGTAAPYGIYDVNRNEGMVNIGQSADTCQFAVESIRQWWRRIGRRHYPDATQLLICADGGGSNSCRTRTWKYFLQDLANETGLEIWVCHYPPGTSKWNKIEHRMFSFISMNWKGQPLVDYETIIILIGNTRTSTGLKIHARLDPYQYEKGIEVSDEEMDKLEWTVDDDLPKWNYTISPQVSV